MTISSLKKPSKHRNRNRTGNQQGEQQQHQQTNGSFSTRSTISDEKEDDDSLTSETDEDKSENIVSSSSLTTTMVNNDSRSMATATFSSNCVTRPTQKSHYSSSNRSKRMSNGQNQTRQTHFDEHFRNSSGSDSSNDDSFDENSKERANLSRKPIVKIVASSKPVNASDQCNSGDEYEHITSKSDRDRTNELEVRFARALKEKKGFTIKPVREDGACLFRAVSDQVFGDEDMHETVRKNCMDYIMKNADFFRAYITEDFDHYVTRKRRQDCHGNHIEMIALSELYNRPIEVYEYSLEPINVVHGMFKTDNEPIRLSYHGGVHYNSIINPWRPTAGHGLGLPDLEPGRAQEALIDTAVRQSEMAHIEHTLLNDEISTTDLEATQDEILQQISRESYLQWLREQEKQSTVDSTSFDHQYRSGLERNLVDETSLLNEQNRNDISFDRISSSSSFSTRDFMIMISSSNASDITSEQRTNERTETNARGASHLVLPFEYDENHLVTSELIDNDDESFMKQVLALSCIEYVESFKKPTDNKDTDR